MKVQSATHAHTASDTVWFIQSLTWNVNHLPVMLSSCLLVYCSFLTLTSALLNAETFDAHTVLHTGLSRLRFLVTSLRATVPTRDQVSIQLGQVSLQLGQVSIQLCGFLVFLLVTFCT